MGGIAGKISSTGMIEKPLLESMIATLKHRGPDGKGVYVDNSGTPAVGLANSRLSVVDLAAGYQLVSNEDGALWAVLDGEICDFPELRERLLGNGHVFKTKGCAEVLLHLYEEKGVAMVEDLNGAFAFAIWDGKNKRFFAARDRVGTKPFNFFYDSKNLVFGSEAKAILEDPG